MCSRKSVGAERTDPRGTPTLIAIISEEEHSRTTQTKNDFINTSSIYRERLFGSPESLTWISLDIPSDTIVVKRKPIGISTVYPLFLYLKPSKVEASRQVSQ